MKTSTSELATIARAVSYPISIRILKLLLQGEELCVCEIVDALQLPQYTCSRRLGVLSRANVVVSRREGKWAYYSLRSPPLAPVRAVLDIIDRRVDDEATYHDLARLKERLARRVDGKCVEAYSGSLRSD